jgi:hypothetical protein
MMVETDTDLGDIADIKSFFDGNGGFDGVCRDVACNVSTIWDDSTGQDFVLHATFIPSF